MEFILQTTDKQQTTEIKLACLCLSLFCKYHIVFAPKYRRKQGLDVGKRVYQECVLA